MISLTFVHNKKRFASSFPTLISSPSIASPLQGKHYRVPNKKPCHRRKHNRQINIFQSAIRQRYRITSRRISPKTIPSKQHLHRPHTIDFSLESFVLLHIILIENLNFPIHEQYQTSSGPKTPIKKSFYSTLRFTMGASWPYLISSILEKDLLPHNLAECLQPEKMTPERHFQRPKLRVKNGLNDDSR